MPVQSAIVPCVAGQWTQLFQRMERRQSLMVQCPQVAMTNIFTAVKPDIIVATMVAANPLRRSLMVYVAGPLGNKVANEVVIGTDSGLTAAGDGINLWLQPDSGLPAVEIDDRWGQWAQLQWYCIAFAAVPVPTLAVYEEIYVCKSIILGLNKSVPLAGAEPIGIWETPELSNGGAEFRLSCESDHDLVIQEWFAWPVGSGTVNVQTFQSFDDPPQSPADITKFTVQMPGLSPHGKQAAKELIDAMTRGDDDDA